VSLLLKAPEYLAWRAMKQRCQNSSCRAYQNYGGRGISICERWKKYENFLADMGSRPGPHYSLDRIDNNGNYEPKNCRWATRKEQGNNRRTTKLICYLGKTMSLKEAAAIAGLDHRVVYKRIEFGWSALKAITTPARKNIRTKI